MQDRKGYIVSLALTAILAGSSLAADASSTVYRWLDSRGNPVHSDRPPPAGTPYEVISAGSSLKRVVTGNEGAVPKEVVPRAGNRFDQIDTNTKEELYKKNPELCALAQTNLSALTTSARVRLRDDNGDYAFLSEEQKAEQIGRAEQMIKVHCP